MKVNGNMKHSVILKLGKLVAFEMPYTLVRAGTYNEDLTSVVTMYATLEGYELTEPNVERVKIEAIRQALRIEKFLFG